MWVFDATPLIYLAKVERLKVVDSLESTPLVPERVYEEVVEVGVTQGYPDARRIERLTEAGSFEVVAVERTSLFRRLRQNSRVSDADVAVLVCADERDATAVMDERYGREVAAVEDIAARGTAYLLLSLVKRNALAADDARATIASMVEHGWYCAPNLYVKIVDKLDSL